MHTFSFLFLKIHALLLCGKVYGDLDARVTTLCNLDYVASV